MIDAEGSCGWNLAMSFILSETFEPDRSCLNKISEIDFAGTTMRTKQIAMQYFGTDNMWDAEKTNATVINIATSIELTHFVLKFGIVLIIFL